MEAWIFWQPENLELICINLGQCFLFYSVVPMDTTSSPAVPLTKGLFKDAHLPVWHLGQGQLKIET